MGERGWQVTAHDPIQKLEENLWTVRTDLPSGRKPGDRRMAIAKMASGELAFFNAAPLEDAALKEIEAWGKPTYLVLPSNTHMVDGHAFAERLGLKVYGPKNDTKMAARVKVEGDFDAFPKDAHVQVMAAAGLKNGEGVMAVISPDGKRKSLMFCDLFMNIPGDNASVLSRLMGFAGGPRFPWLVKQFLVKDRSALKTQANHWANDTKIARLIPTHGRILDTHARSELRKLVDAI